MGFWNIITPEESINRVNNPSFEVNETDGWTKSSLVTVLRSSSNQRFGVYSVAITPGAVTTATFDSNTITLSNGDDVAMSAWVYQSSTADVTLIIRDTTTGADRATTALTTAQLGKWTRLEATWNNTTGSDADVLLRMENPVSGNTYSLDGAQMETTAYTTTYLDGDQKGCLWFGIHHNGGSQRNANEASGGRIQNFETDLEFPISQMSGIGMPPTQIGAAPYAILDGSQFQSDRLAQRPFSLVSTMSGSVSGGGVLDMTEYHANRQLLIKAFNARTVLLNRKADPRRFIYTGATAEKYIDAYYDAGLETKLVKGFTETVNMRFIAPDPNWYETGQAGKELDGTAQSSTFRLVARRGRNGLWDTMGPPSGGTYGNMWAIAAGLNDGYIYFGGNFTAFDATDQDYIVRFDTEDSSWLTMTTSKPDGIVYSIAVAPNGDVYICGDFTIIGAIADTSRVAYWDGTAWNGLTTGATDDIVRDIMFDEGGTLWAVGAFTSIQGQAAAGIATWDGSSWSAIGAGLAGNDADGYALALAPNGDVYVGGSFTTASGTSATNIACYAGAGSTATALSTGANSTVYDLAVTDAGDLFLCGNFTTAGGTTTNYVAKWNGTTFEALRSGLNALTRRLGILRDSSIMFAGDFTAENGGTAGSRPSVTIWNGSVFKPLDIDPGTGVRGILDYNGLLYLGHDTDGSLDYADDTTISYTGTGNAHPIIKFVNEGATDDFLMTLINERTDAGLWFDYWRIQPGETITINTGRNEWSIVSSKYGSIPNAILASSNTSSFFLQPKKRLRQQ